MCPIKMCVFTCCLFVFGVLFLFFPAINAAVFGTDTVSQIWETSEVNYELGSLSWVVADQTSTSVCGQSSAGVVFFFFFWPP